MANRHKSQSKGGRNVSYGNMSVVNESKQGNAAGVSATAAKGNIGKREGGAVTGKATGGRLDKRARGGGVGSDRSPFSSAAFSKGGAVKKK